MSDFEARAVAAEAALAEANRRADDLAGALRTIRDTDGSTDKAWQRWAHGVARAALDRHTRQR